MDIYELQAHIKRMRDMYNTYGEEAKEFAKKTSTNMFVASRQLEKANQAVEEAINAIRGW